MRPAAITCRPGCCSRNILIKYMNLLATFNIGEHDVSFLLFANSYFDLFNFVAYQINGIKTGLISYVEKWECAFKHSNYHNYQCHQVSGLMFCNQNQPELGPKVFGNYGVYPLGALIHEIDIGVGHRLSQPGASGARKFEKNRVIG